MRDLPKIKLKYLCKSFSSALIARELKTDIQEGYPVFGAAGLMGYKDTYDLESEYLGIVKDGAGVGRINIYPAKSSLLGTMAAIIPNPNVSISWLKYAITSLNLGESVDKATIPHIYFSVYGNSFIWDISKEMQQAIADILDRKCTQIDALISNEEQQIAKLKAYKQSVITETVTKGLNPDVPMKYSGVEWIGEIPEHWEVLQLSSLVTERKHKNTNMQETNLLSLSYGKIIRKDIKTKDGLLPDNFEGYNIVECGDIVLRLTDLQNDHKSLRTGLCKERGIITSAYVTLANRGKTVISTYLNYLLHTFDVYKGFYGMGAGVRQGLNFEGVKKILLSIPPINEQQQIADYLDKKCEQIDRLIAIKQQKIEKLQQYKKSVIYEYVTGKREVE